MTQVQTSIATAADYADAMITARRAKNWLFALLLLILLAQLTVFFVAAYTRTFDPAIGDAPAAVSAPQSEPTTAPAVEAATEATARVADAVSDAAAARPTRNATLLEYVVAASTFLGMGSVIVLAIVLLLIVLIMLIGRLIGVSRVTSAFIWCVILAVLLFPWQAFLNYGGLAGANFRIPGVLYTWTELSENAKFMHNEALPLMEKVLKWARFVGFPIVAIVILLLVQSKSGRGLKLALGEADAEIAPNRV